jgi:hypothetical protein
MSRNLLHTAVLLLAATWAAPAAAYMGPGAGLGMLGSALAVIGAVLVAVFGLLLFPIRMLIKRRRRNGQAAKP